MIAADIDDLHVLRNARQRIGRGARRQGREQHVELRQCRGIPLLDRQPGQLGRQSGKAVCQSAACTALARGIHEFEERVPRDQTQRLAAAEAADSNDADANAHDDVLSSLGKTKPPERRLRGFRNAGRSISGGRDLG